MANVKVREESLIAIGKAIRKKNSTDTYYKPSEMAQSILDIPDKYDKGYTTGYDEGYKKGASDYTKEEQEKTVDITENGTTTILPDENKALSKVIVNVDVADSYYDAFWDAFQQNGERTYYEKAFYGAYWNNDNFKPKYDLIIEGNGTSVFQNNLISGDFAQLLKDCNVTLDTSKCTSLFATFQGVQMTKVPHISCEGTNSANSLFYGANLLETIEKLTVHANLNYTQAFNICRALKNITIEGEIGKSIAFAQSYLLTTESVDSIINALLDLTGQENQKISFHTDIILQLTEEQLNKITSRNWVVG